MLSDPDQFLNRIVVAALTVFVTVSLLLAAFVFREIWLQQRISNLSTTLQDNLDDLEQTTEEIQGELAAIQTITTTAQQTENLDNVTDLLTDANEQLDAIEEDINQVTTILEPETDVLAVATEEAEPVIQDRADQVFTIFAMLVGVAGVVIAILLGMAVSVQQRASSRGNPRP
jgi:ABC-type multidrug transport system fused ATPase/permease subunit